MLNKQQQTVVDTLSGPIMVMSVAGSGKALMNGTRVLTPTGYVPIEKLKVDDEIFGRDGNIYNVLGVYPQGKKEVYEIEFSDGSIIKCCEDHLWNYQPWHYREKKSSKYLTNTTKYILEKEKLILPRKTPRPNIYIPMCQPLNFRKNPLPLKPYSLGVLLGDKVLGRNISIHGVWKDVEKKMNEELEEINCKLEFVKKYHFSVSSTDNFEQLENVLRGLGILEDTRDIDTGKMIRRYNKFVPDIYKYSDVNDRLELLRGLIDVGGHCIGSSFECYTVSRRLSEDIKFLAETLGCTAMITSKAVSNKYEQAYNLSHLLYRIYINAPSYCHKLFFSQLRKDEKKRGQAYSRRSITRITPTGKYEEMTCIKTSSRDELFITENCIVTHNTTTIVHRIANLIENKVPSNNILGLTFTKDAAAEMYNRVRDFVGNAAYGITLCTFHSFAYKKIKEDGELIGLKDVKPISSDSERTNIVNECLEDLNLKKKYKGKNDPSDIRKLIDMAKVNLVYAGDYLSSNMDSDKFSKTDISRVYIKYQQKLKEKGLIDFNDMILGINKLLDIPEVLNRYAEEYKYIFVDEYQDNNLGQQRIVLKLAEKHRNICVVGDLNQTIFSFQGANPHGADDFVKAFPEYKLIKMEQNYRSTPSIIEAANSLISYNPKTIFSTNMVTDNQSKTLVNVLESVKPEDECEMIYKDIMKRLGNDPSLKYNDFAILYRANHLANMYRKKFVDNKVPIILNDKEEYFYNKPEIKAFLSYFRVLTDPSTDNIAENMMLRSGIGAETVSKLKGCAADHNITLLRAIEYNVTKNPMYLCKNITRQLPHLQAFLNDYYYLANFSQNNSLSDLVKLIAEESPYMRELNDPSNRNSEFNKIRLENIYTLQADIDNFIYECQQANETPVISKFLEDIDSISRPDIVKEENGIVLSSIHRAKGREFKYVYLVGFENRILPDFRSLYGADLEEERRIAYVAITRAKEVLTICYCQYRKNPYTKSLDPSSPSPFLDEIPSKFLKNI